MNWTKLSAALVICLASAAQAKAGLFDLFCCHDSYCQPTCCAPVYCEPISCEPMCCEPVCAMPTDCGMPMNCAMPMECCAPIQYCAPQCCPQPCCPQPCCPSRSCNSGHECCLKKLVRWIWRCEHRKNSWFADRFNMCYPYQEASYGGGYGGGCGYPMTYGCGGDMGCYGSYGSYGCGY